MQHLFLITNYRTKFLLPLSSDRFAVSQLDLHHLERSVKAKIIALHFDWFIFSNNGTEITVKINYLGFQLLFLAFQLLLLDELLLDLHYLDLSLLKNLWNYENEKKIWWTYNIHDRLSYNSNLPLQKQSGWWCGTLFRSQTDLAPSLI